MRTEMKSLMLTGAALFLASAGPAAAETVRLQNVAARVTVVPENRPDVVVEVRAGTGDVVAPRVVRAGSTVTVQGVLPGRIDGCSGMKAGADRGTVKFKDRRNVAVKDLPSVIVRTPMDVDLFVQGAAVGVIGKARSVKLRTETCGNWSAAGTTGLFDVGTEGMGDVTVGPTGALKVALEGVGDVDAGPTRALTVGLEGMGDVRVASLNGPADVSVEGMGGVKIAGGRATTFKAALAGMGNVKFDGAAERLDASVDGMGQVRVARVTGAVNRRVSGFGRVKVGE